jgi:hypothetical protein
MQHYLRSTLMQIRQIKGFELAAPNCEKGPNAEGNESSEASGNEPEIKEIF